jgi:hypothetical protein
LRLIRKIGRRVEINSAKILQKCFFMDVKEHYCVGTKNGDEKKVVDGEKENSSPKKMEMKQQKRKKPDPNQSLIEPILGKKPAKGAESQAEESATVLSKEVKEAKPEKEARNPVLPVFEAWVRLHVIENVTADGLPRIRARSPG